MNKKRLPNPSPCQIAKLEWGFRQKITNALQVQSRLGFRTLYDAQKFLLYVAVLTAPSASSRPSNEYLVNKLKRSLTSIRRDFRMFERLGVMRRELLHYGKLQAHKGRIIPRMTHRYILSDYVKLWKPYQPTPPLQRPYRLQEICSKYRISAEIREGYLEHTPEGRPYMVDKYTGKSLGWVTTDCLSGRLELPGGQYAYI